MNAETGDRNEEASLIQAARRGDTEAFGQLYELFAASVFRFIYSRLDDRLDAEDLTEEVFLRAWKSLPSFQERGVPFVSFLLRIAQNMLADHYRRINREGIPTQVGDDELDHIQADSGLAGRDLVSTEIRRSLNKLKFNQRNVLTMRFLSGLSVKETAHALKKSPEAIRVMQHRALAALREMLKDDQVSNE